MMKVLLVIVTITILFIGVAINFNMPKWENLSVNATQKILEPPFHFLLKLPGYNEAQFMHDSDIFSTWGQLVLIKNDGYHSTRTEILKKLSMEARNAGWNTVDSLDDLQAPDLTSYSIDSQKEDLAFQKSSVLPDQNPPTRYSCRIWIAQDGNLIVTSWRVDGE